MELTQNQKLGANAILGVSMATAKSCSRFSRNISLSVPWRSKFEGFYRFPFMNIVNGGEHADNSLDIQEFMVAPIGLKTFKEALRAGAETFHNLKKILKAEGHVYGSLEMKVDSHLISIAMKKLFSTL